MEKGETTVIPLEVTLDDLYLGRTLRVAHKKQIMCTKCRGTGAKDPKDVKICPGCKGTGMKMKTQYGHGFIQQFQTVYARHLIVSCARRVRVSAVCG